MSDRPARIRLVLLDLSRSMNAVDESVSRLVIAKRAISQIAVPMPAIDAQP